MISRRPRLLWHFANGRRNGTSLPDTFRVVFRPTCSVRARSVIDKIETDGQWHAIRLKGISKPLFFPRSLSLQELYQVVAEQLTGNDWHQYEAWGTRVDKDDVVLDCGAAEGLFTLITADRCKHVYAAEPLPSFVSSLKRTFQSQANVDILPLALGSRTRRVSISGDGIVASVNEVGQGVPIDMTTVDELFANRNRPVTYIKADLEGMELHLIEGARETLMKYAPKIAITTYHVAGHARQLTEMILDCNPKYTIRCKGIEERAGAPVMLHAWVKHD